MKTGKKCTASHLLLYIALAVYFLVAILALGSVGYMIYLGEYDYAQNLFVGLFSFCGVCGSCTIAFYCNKAKAENEILLENAKYDKRLELAKIICSDLKDGKIDDRAVAILEALVSDSNSFSIDSIDDEINNERG